MYINFSIFSRTGSVGYGYITQGSYGVVLVCVLGVLTCCYFPVYNHHAYIEIVDRLAQHFMQAVVVEVQTLPEYSTEGEVQLLSPNMLCVLHLILANSGS